MPITFPSNPSDQDEYTFNGRTYTYNASRGVWLGSRGGSVSAGGGGGAALTVSDTAPTSANEGDLWFHSTLLETYVYYNSQWVLSNPSGSGGGSGASLTTSDTAPATPTAGDLWFNSTDLTTYVYYDDGSSSQWVSSVPSGVTAGSSGGGGGAGVTTYADITARDAATPSQGDLAFVTSVTALYVYDGSEWDRIWSGGQETVVWNTELDPEYGLIINRPATTLTVSASDPDGFDITYDYSTVPSDISTIATITQGTGANSNSFDILPDTTNTGSFTFRVTADDGVSKISTTSDVRIVNYEKLTNLSGGTGGTGGQSTYTASGGMVVTAPNPTYSSGSNYWMEYLFDGNIDSGAATEYWLTTGGTNDYLTFNLSNHTSPYGGNVSFLGKIVIYPKCRTDSFTNVTSIEWSTDGTTWTQSHGDQGWTDALALGYNEEFIIEQEATYFRIGMSRTGQWGFSLHEVEIYAG